MASEYRVTYAFSDGPASNVQVLRSPVRNIPLAVDEMLLSGATNGQIRARFPELSRAYVHARRRRLELAELRRDTPPSVQDRREKTG
jgi:hypothetical protein